MKNYIEIRARPTEVLFLCSKIIFLQRKESEESEGNEENDKQCN